MNKALTVLDEMERLGLKPTLEIYSVLIEGVPRLIRFFLFLLFVSPISQFLLFCIFTSFSLPLFLCAPLFRHLLSNFVPLSVSSFHLLI